MKDVLPQSKFNCEKSSQIDRSYEQFEKNTNESLSKKRILLINEEDFIFRRKKSKLDSVKNELPRSNNMIKNCKENENCDAELKLINKKSSIQLPCNIL